MATTIYNREELQTLATFLLNYQQIPGYYYRIDYWCCSIELLPKEDQVRFDFIQPNEPELTTGLVACAIGHLRLLCPKTELVAENNEVYLAHPCGIRYTSFYAISEYFNIAIEHATNLFSPHNYEETDWANPAIQGQRIQAFLNANP